MTSLFRLHQSLFVAIILMMLAAILVPSSRSFTPRINPIRKRTCCTLQANGDDINQNQVPSQRHHSAPPFQLDRRTALVSTMLLTTTTTNPTSAQAEITSDSIWPLWTALPVAPYSRRKTIFQDLGNGVYIFDQLIGIYYVHVPIRMTVIALEKGLFVYAPVAPTRECLHYMQFLIEKHGPVQYIVLPSVAVEHKVNAGPFARAFSNAEFYAVDKQYAFPINLPDVALGLPSWTKSLPRKNGEKMWNGELQHDVLTVKPGPGSEFQEAAFYHSKSKTLILCDTLVAVQEEPPTILTEESEYTRALLFHARDSPLEVVQDTPQARRKGWRRIVLLFNFFFPAAAVADLGIGPLLALRPYSLGWGGWKPFEWKSPEDEIKSFQTYSNNGKATIFPIIQIILARGNSGQATQEWVNRVSKWDFTRVIPAHLDAPLAMGPAEFRSNFDFIQEGVNKVRFCDEDVAFLRSAEEGFLNFSVYKSKLGPLQGVAVNDQKDVRTCNFGGKFFSRNDFFPGKTVKNENR